MEHKKLLFLINPHAGKSEIKYHALTIIDLFIQNKWEVTVYTTQHALEIPKLISSYEGSFDLLVCCGGDGTLNETVNGLMCCQNRPLLGYIPAGTVNDFASSLHISKNMLTAAHDIIYGRPFLCDIGLFNKRYFTYIAAFGAFTDISYQTPQQAKNLLGRAAYFLEGIKRLPLMKPYSMTLTHDSGTLSGDFIFGMVTNSTSVGGFKIKEGFPVSMNDGLLEVLLIRNITSVIQAKQIINAVLRQEFDSEFVIAIHTSHLFIHSEEPVSWTLDGEYGGCIDSVHIDNQHHALSILSALKPSKEAI